MVAPACCRLVQFSYLKAQLVVLMSIYCFSSVSTGSSVKLILLCRGLSCISLRSSYTSSKIPRCFSSFWICKNLSSILGIGLLSVGRGGGVSKLIGQTMVCFEGICSFKVFFLNVGVGFSKISELMELKFMRARSVSPLSLID